MSGSFRQAQRRRLFRADGTPARSAPGEGKEAKQEEPRKVRDLIPIRQMVKGGDERMVIAGFAMTRWGGGEHKKLAQKIAEEGRESWPYLGFHLVDADATFFPAELPDQDDQRLKALQRWVEAWCRSNTSFPFQLNTALLEPRDGVTRVDVLYWYNIAPNDLAFPCFQEAADFLGGRGARMQHWFLRRHAETRLKELRKRREFWTGSVPGPIQTLGGRIFRRPDGGPKSDQGKFELVRGWGWSEGREARRLRRQAGDGEAQVAALEKLQKDIPFLEDALAGQGESLDVRRLFQILEDSDEAPDASLDPQWWYEEARVSWERCRRGGDRKEGLSWGGRMAARFNPSDCLTLYIQLYYARGAARIGNFQTLLAGGPLHALQEKHPVVRATKTGLLSKWVRPDPQSDKRELGFNLASYTTSFLAGRVKLLKE
jgi:hypothetical protein